MPNLVYFYLPICTLNALFLFIGHLSLVVAFSTTPDGLAIIAQSGPNTIITSPSPSANGIVVALAYPQNITQNPASQWIWYGPGNNSDCPMQITVSQSFTMKCLNQDLYFYVAADNYYTAIIGNYTLSGNNWAAPNNYTLSTAGIACGILFDKLGTQLTWTIVANNIPMTSAGPNCLNNPAALIYSILSPDCPCTSSQIYDSQICGCSPCNKTLIGCITCSLSTVCTLCDINNYFISNGNYCICTTGYILVGYLCQSCSNLIPYCSICDSTTKCKGCINNKYLLVNHSCIACSNILGNCQTCISSSICATCIDSYIINSNLCVSCSSVLTGCLTCSSLTVCLTCNTSGSFTLASNTCSCNDGYILYSSNCQLCNVNLVNCISCSSISICTQCSNSSYIVYNSICTLCNAMLSYCLTCNSSSYCLTCDTNQHYDSLAKLGLCKCQSGYTLINNSCVLCSTLINGCISCSSSSVCTSCNASLNFNPTPNITNQCTCANTYILNNTNICVLCSSVLLNCNTCTSQSVCIICDSNYILNPNGIDCLSCNAVVPGCSTCNTTNCLSCETNLIEMINILSGIFCICVNESYYFDGTNCILCDPLFPGCSQCQVIANFPITLSCSNCLDSYYSVGNIITSITNCIACSTIIPGCISCSPGICNFCDTSLFYGLIPVGNICNCVNNSYIIDMSNNCVACNTISALGSCSQCSSTSVCTVCINNTYAIDINNICTDCSALLIGCLTCDNSINCLTCDLTTYVPSGLTQNTCICNNLSTMNNSICTLCSSLKLNCITCSNYQTCTTCISLYTSSNGNCVLCSSILTLGQCINCSSSTTCTLCQANYFPDNSGVCKPCSYYMTNCTICSSNNICLACDTGFALDPNNNNLCSPCSTFMIGCLLCSTSQICNNCDSNKYLGINIMNTCSCINDLIFYNSQCLSCPQIYSNCINCTIYVCTSCLANYYIDQNNNCKHCEYSCLVCNLTNGCSYCDSILPISLIFDVNNYGNCVCAVGYFMNTTNPNNNYCQSICGDGYLIIPDEQCDDNNLINGDGCSSLCVVQTNYTCTNNPVDISVCSYNQPFSIAIQSILKSPDSNTLTFTIQIGPNISSLTSVNFSNIISSNVSLSNPIYTYQINGTLTISYNYNSTLQGQTAQFTFNPALAGSNFSQSPSSNLTVHLISANNLPIAFYNQFVYDESKKYKDAYVAAQVISYVIFAIGMFCNKIIGIELFGVLQVAFLSVSTINQIQPLLEPLNHLKSVNGINNQFKFNSIQLPIRVKNIGYEASFLSNFNYMFWIMLGTILTGFGFYLMSKSIGRFSNKFNIIYKSILKQYLLTLALYNILNISYSAGLQFTYNKTIFSLNSSVTVLCLLVLAAIGFFYVFQKDQSGFSEFKQYFKPNTICKSYFIFTIVYRTILGVCLSQMNEWEEITLVMFIVSMFYFMFLISYLPFKNGYQNYRAVFIQCSLMICLLIAMYYNAIEGAMNAANISQILSPALFEIISIFVAVGISALTLCYQMYLKYIKKQVLIKQADDQAINTRIHKPRNRLKQIKNTEENITKNDIIFSLQESVVVSTFQ